MIILKRRGNTNILLEDKIDEKGINGGKPKKNVCVR